MGSIEAMQLGSRPLFQDVEDDIVLVPENCSPRSYKGHLLRDFPMTGLRTEMRYLAKSIATLKEDEEIVRITNSGNY
jgi:hypothetical protein